MLGKEALVVLANLSQLIAPKIKEPFSQVYGWVNVQIIIIAVRLYSHMIHGYCFPSPLRYQELYWDPLSGLGFTQ